MLVLLVDDDEEARKTMGLILEMEGIEVCHAGSGRAALERINQTGGNIPSVDLMVLDLDMADMSGLELLHEMQKSTCAIPVIVVSGFATKKTVVDLLRYGVVDYLEKPIQMKDFKVRVKRKIRATPLTGKKGRLEE